MAPGSRCQALGVVQEKMKLVATILLFYAVALVSSAEPVVSLIYVNNRWAPNTQIEITVNSKGLLAFKSDAKIMSNVPRQVQLPLKKFEALKRVLDEVEWEKISADKIEGRDGISIQISYGKQSASLWSPNYNSKKRGLCSIDKAIEIILDLSGLDRSALPNRDKEAEQEAGGCDGEKLHS